MHPTALDDAAWDSPWRRVRVGEKLLLGLGLVVTALVSPAWPGSVLVAMAAVGLALGPARIPARTLALAVAPPLAFIVVGAASVAVRVGEPAPDALGAVGPLSVDPATLLRAADVLGHAVAGTLAVLLIATTTPMVDLLTWFRRLGVPGPLIDVASLIYRLLFVLLATALGIREAQLARCADAPGVGLRRRFEHAASATGAVLVRSWDRALRLTHGLDARGLDGDLVALPVRRPASPGFVAGSVALLAVVWGLVVLAGFAGGAA